MKAVLYYCLSIALIIYVLGCEFLYFKQESFLFHPQKLPASYQFKFPGKYIEFPVTASDGIQLSGLLFQVENSKGLVFFLHGNSGSLADWGGLATTYTHLGYDVFMLDYRGYGKSAGSISSQEQLLSDAEAAYQQLIAKYAESRVVLVGYSLGTGPAAWLATRHRPRLLLLHAPYYSMADLVSRLVVVWPLLPDWLLRYPLPTNEFVQQAQAPVVLFHGTEDKLIPFDSSVRLRSLLRPGGHLVTIQGAGHNGLLAELQYQQAIERLLR